MKSTLSDMKNSIYSLNVIFNLKMLQKYDIMNSFIIQIPERQLIIYVMFKLQNYRKILANFVYQQLLNEINFQGFRCVF